MAPAYIVLDVGEHVEFFINSLAEVNHELVLPETVASYVEDMLMHMHDRVHQADYAEAYISDCIEVFANDVEENLIGPKSNAALALGMGLRALWQAIYQRLLDIGAYQGNVFNYCFHGFLGYDVVMQYLPPYPNNNTRTNASMGL